MNPSTTPSTIQDENVRHELIHLKRHWWGLLLLGALLIICGIVALSYPFITTLSVAIVLGAALLVAGIATIVSSFWTGSWSAFLVQVLVGILYTVVGMMTMDSPVAASGALTLLVAAMFIVGGIFRMAAAIMIRFPQWGWVLLNGAVALVLGILLYKQFPESALWLLGTIFGIDMILFGWCWIMLALEVRGAADAIETKIEEHSHEG